MIIHAAGLGYMHAELSEKESSALCVLLGVDDIDLKHVFVTFIREDLTDAESTYKLHSHGGGDPDQDDLPF